MGKRIKVSTAIAFSYLAVKTDTIKHFVTILVVVTLCENDRTKSDDADEEVEDVSPPRNYRSWRRRRRRVLCSTRFHTDAMIVRAESERLRLTMNTKLQPNPPREN